jgi:hypothetical protein
MNFNAAARLLRKTIYPRAGDKGEVHNDNLVVLYHVLFGKPFDIIDFMFKEIQKTCTDTRIKIIYAPYIMLLIDRATKREIIPRSEGSIYTKHSVYRVEVLETKEPQNKKASKSKKLMCVPPLVKQRRHQ